MEPNLAVMILGKKRLSFMIMRPKRGELGKYFLGSNDR
jgi:hypothetical protein